jgi:hypothetical protein
VTTNLTSDQLAAIENGTGLCCPFHTDTCRQVDVCCDTCPTTAPAADEGRFYPPLVVVDESYTWTAEETDRFLAAIQRNNADMHRAVNIQGNVYGPSTVRAESGQRW